jgi:hypothetical protein
MIGLEIGAQSKCDQAVVVLRAPGEREEGKGEKRAARDVGHLLNSCMATKVGPCVFVFEEVELVPDGFPMVGDGDALCRWGARVDIELDADGAQAVGCAGDRWMLSNCRRSAANVGRVGGRDSMVQEA